MSLGPRHYALTGAHYEDRTEIMVTETVKREASRAGQAMDEQELAHQVDSLRAELAKLTETVGSMAGRQIDRAQDYAKETAEEAEAAIRRNPLTAVAIAVGLGFLFGLLTRVR
jgi:ElaB/YqjD/DUF883 family membrane-anchored ribosome-binding protein